jgi:catechol 2,3-dioxygenase-like lactoylglutathione lyase family enzyme
MRWILAACIVLTACSSKRSERDSPLVAEAKRCGDDCPELTAPRPILNVHSLKASQAYYRDKLGFKVDWDHGDPPNFGQVSRGDFALFLCEQCLSAPGAWSMTFVANVDKLHEEFARRGAIIRQPPRDEPWGLREMQIADPDGNVIRFGAHGDHD